MKIIFLRYKWALIYSFDKIAWLSIQEISFMVEQIIYAEASSLSVRRK